MPEPDPAPSRSAPVVVFDFDGVLVRGDSFESFLRHRLRVQWWRGLPVLPLVPFVPLLLRSAWGKGWLARVFARLASFGLSVAAFERIVAEFARDFAANPTNFYADGIACLQGYREAGARVIVSSATEAGLLDALLASLGLAGVERIGSTIAMSPLGLRVVRHNYGATKTVLLAERCGLARWDVAYSDAWSDLPLLQGADEAVGVNVDAALAERFVAQLGERFRVVRWD